ncbi:hypothetical protein Ahy_A03g013981 isoform B [Arachis hypogaea]|uniref:Cytochrome P450 n=1 Tax=Arachis hypogaea TaxID=3818 RepID=A0A445DWL0_ARAHY|nr:hypothetical protein Ahy_A03g013981 isoform B [Arachis hypogaea]
MEVALSIVEKLQHQPNSTLSTICFIIITILCVLINKFTRRNNKFNKLPPSPPKLPIIGNLHQLGTLPHQSLKALSDKYGPILLLQLGQTKALVVSSADIVEEIVKTHDVAFSNRANTKAAKVLFYQCKEIAFAPYGEEWRNKRKLCVLELLNTNRKVQEEVRRIVGGKSMIEENDLNQMKYMKCVIKETLRLHPPGPLLIPRETANSVEIKGYHIPKKVTVYINSYAIHRDPKLWDNAEEFIPERFEGAQQVDYKVKDFQLIPFGFGRRRCPGISFGVASVEYMMANLLCWFDWKFTRRNNKFNKLPPSPPKLPIIGNLHQLGTLPHQSLKALSDKYGPILLLQLGQTKALVVSSADIVEEIVKTHDVAFSNRANTKAAKVLFYQCKEIAFAPYGEEWRNKRKLCVLELLNTNRFTRRNNKFNKLPPSPPKLPIIGNLHQLGTLPHQSLKALSDKYGPILLLQLGQTKALVVSSADIVEEIVKTHDVAFSNRANTKAAKVLFYQCKEIAFAPYGEEWRNKRKLCVLELLNTNRVKSFHPVRTNEVSTMINSIHEACAKGSSVNLSKLIIVTSSNISYRCIFGLRFETSDDGQKSIAEVVRKMMSQFLKFGVGDLFPSLDWVDVLTGFMSRLKVTFAELDEFLEEVIEEHKRKKRDDNNKDFVDILLQLQERDMLDFELNGDTMKALLLDLLVAGSDSISSTIEWAFAELANSPKVMKKVQEEVRRIVGGKSMIEENDLNQMNYMKCVIKETLRLHPPGPFLIPRETANSVEIKGYHIPKKVTVYINSYAIHRDPKLWDNAEEFIPERFEGNQQIDYKVIDSQFIPFGIGRRGCPGMSFGVASLEYVIANLLYWFDWNVPNNNNSALIDMSEISGLNISKKQPLYLKPIPYQPNSFSQTVS